MMSRTGSFGDWLPCFVAALFGLFLTGVILMPRSARAACSPYVGAMVINEVYELNNNDVWVEVRLLDDSVPASEYGDWSIRVCSQGGGGGCGTYDISDGTVLYPDTYPYWIRLNVDFHQVDLRSNGGMDVVLRDENGYAIDYLSVNNYTAHQPTCSSYLYPTTTGALASDLKGVYRDPDGTGPWLQLGESGANGEPTEGYDNNTIEGLVAHYALEDNANDSSINGLDGSSQGTVAYERAVICDGVVLDGSGYLTVPDNDAFDLRRSLTVTAWIRADSLSMTGHDNLYTILSKDTNYEFHVRADGSLYWWWDGGSFTTGAGVVVPGTWYHFAAVYSRSDGAMRIYLDGQQVASHPYSSQLTTNSDPLYIGTDKGSSGDWPERRFVGAIDEVHIYNAALSQASITELMNESNPCEVPTPVAEWRFDECDYDGSGALAEDTQGSHDATAQGTVTSEAEAVVGRSATLDEHADRFTLNNDVPMTGNWTVSAWFKMPFVNDDGQKYHVLGAMAGGNNDLLWVDDTWNYRWGCWAGGAWSYGNFYFSSLTDGWHHLVAVGSYGKTRLYIDGTYRDTIALQGSGNLHYLASSCEDCWIERKEGWRAPLDEYLVFDGVLTLPQIQTLYQLQSEGRNLDGTLRPDILCGVGIDHFEIVHDGSALTCVPEAVTVTACADDADPCTQYTGDVEVTLTPSGWISDDTQTLTGGSGTVRLRHTTAETVTLAVASSDPAADNGYECVDGSSGTSCELVFHEAGFLFDVPDVTSCAQEDNIVIAAVRADATAEHCVGDDSFAGTTRSIAFWSGYQQPDSGTRSVYVNTTEVDDASPGTAVSLTFDSNAESSLSVQYADAGQVQLTAHFEVSDPTDDEYGLVMEGSDSFIAVPAKLLVSAEQTDGTPLTSTDPDGSYHIPAGEDFLVTVSGACADNSVTPNFAAATTLEAVSPFQPATGGRLGDFTPATLAAGAYSAGVAEDVTSTYSEVGTVTLQAVAADYLGTGTDVTGTSGTIGRFTPYHFAVSLNSPEFATGCATGGFTYIGQPFGYATAPVITVTAQNKQNATTENYEGEWWKMAAGNLTEKKYPSAAGTLVLSGLPGTDPTVTPLIDGMGLVKFSAGSGLVFERDYDPVEPFDADIALKINVLDGDDIAATTNPVTFGEATAGGGMDFDNGKEMRWGRLAMQNAYGSERVALAMPLRAEYYSGSAFVPNNADGCTGLALSKITLSNSSGSVTADNPIQVGDSGSSSASLLNNPMVAGEAGLSFSASGDDGYIDVQPDLSSMAWLQYDWDGDDSHDDNPTARASFGLFKGRPALIYLRENYRAE